MWKRNTLLLGSIFLVAVAFFLVWHDEEPRYQGHTLSRWLAMSDTSSQEFAPDQTQQAQEAIRHIGTNGLPFLVSWISQEPRSPNNSLLRSLPRPIKGLLYGIAFSRQKRNRCLQALRAFQLLAENAAPAVPALTGMLNPRNSLYLRQNAAVALASIGTNGLPPLLDALSNTNYLQREIVVAVVPLISNAVPVIPLLIKCTQDSDPNLAFMAVQALGRLQIAPEVIVPAITNAFAHTNSDVRFMAAQCFATWLGAEAYRAAPALQNLLNDPEYRVRQAASNLLAKIQSRALTNAPPR